MHGLAEEQSLGEVSDPCCNKIKWNEMEWIVIVIVIITITVIIIFVYSWNYHHCINKYYILVVVLLLSSL